MRSRITILFGSALALLTLALAPALLVAQDDGAAPIVVRQANITIDNGGEYFTPMNRSNNAIALFSAHPGELMQIFNESEADVVINSVTIEGQGNARPEEWTLTSAEDLQQELAIEDQPLPAGERLAFYPAFYPMEGTERVAIITIVYNGDRTYSFTIKGRGRPAATFCSHATETMALLLGEGNEDEMLGTLVADEQGNLYVSANHSPKDANRRVYIARINVDGSMGWLRAFDGPFTDEQRDCGQNGETGGTANSIALGPDGALYAMANMSANKSNNTFRNWVGKIDIETGDLVWSSIWQAKEEIKLVNDASVAYALDARSDKRVFLVGDRVGQVLVVALDKLDGSVAFSRTIEIVERYNDKGYAVRSFGNDTLYIAGISNRYAFLTKLAGVDGAEPEVAWSREVNVGWGSNICDLDVDAEGNIFAAFDVRGSKTSFAFGKFSPEGELLWTNRCGDTRSQRNSTHTIRVIGDSVYIAGKIAPPRLDGQMGDGHVAVVDRVSGELQWCAHYYTGTGPDEICEHRVKGIAVVGNKLILGTQVYTGNKNGVRYFGYWYDGLTEYKPYEQCEVKEQAVTMSLAGADADGNANDGYTTPLPMNDPDAEIGALWMDITGPVLKNALEKQEATPPDGEIMIQVLALKD